MRIRSILCALLVAIGALVAAATGPAMAAAVAPAAAPPAVAAPAAAPPAAASPAVTEHTVTLVNQTTQTVWVGSSVNADGSTALTGLPTLAPGATATVTIPENSTAQHWRGTLFAREGCSGTDGSSFHCVIGDCGTATDRCTTGEQPVSLAEFNFDPSDSLAPWYDVSYVNAFSLAVTIDPDGVPVQPSGTCSEAGCPDDLMPYCPAANLTTDAGTGLQNCVSPNRDAQTPYSDAMGSHCPLAYSWSKADQVPGNQVVRQCVGCSGFTVTFH